MEHLQRTPVNNKSLLLVCAALLIKCQLSSAAAIGDIITIERYDGEQLGPYIWKEFHSDHDIPVAAHLSSDSEGSGYEGSGAYDDVETGDDDTETADSPTNYNGIATATTAPEARPVPLLFDGAYLITSEAAILVTEVVSSTTQTHVSSTLSHASDTSLYTTTTYLPTASTSPSHATNTPPPIPPITSARPTLSTTPSSLCHNACLEELHASFVMAVTPNVSLIQEGETLVLLCQISTTRDGAEEVQLQWIFEGENPAKRECSLDKQQYLAECDNFSSIYEDVDRNSTHLTSTLIISQLTTHNSGYYMCQAVLHCCGDILQQQQRHHLTVWTADYTTELLTMGCIAAGLFLVLVCYLIYTYKREQAARHLYMQITAVPVTQATMYSKVLHLPVVAEETASFSSFDSTQ